MLFELFAVSRQMVENWFVDFKSDRTVHIILLANGQLKLQKIADTLKIFKERIGFILHEKVDFKLGAAFTASGLKITTCR